MERKKERFVEELFELVFETMILFMLIGASSTEG